MPYTQLSAIQKTEIDRPSCQQCGARMWLARISPDGPGKEHRGFECPVCEISTGQSDLQKRGTKMES